MTAPASVCSRYTTCATRSQPSASWTRLSVELPFRVLVIQDRQWRRVPVQLPHWHLEERDIRHVYIRPRTPRLNGKVERSHRVDEQEFYQLLDKDGIGDDIHLFNDKLHEVGGLLQFYHRPHGALDGQTPYERLLAKKTSAKVLPKS